MSQSRVPRRTLIVLVLAAASWGVGTVISKRAVAEIQPFVLLAVQLTASVVALGIVLILTRRRAQPGAGPLRTASPASLDRLGLLNPGAAYALSLIGLTQITASLSVLLWAGEPILILILAWAWLREPITRRLVGLSIAGLAGIALVTWSPGLAGQGGGIVVTLAGVGCCAVYSVMARTRIGAATSTVRVVFGQQVWALGLALLMLLTSVIVAPSASSDQPAAPVSIGAWASAVVSGLVYYGLAYGFYLNGLRRVPASVAASAFYLIPVFGVTAGWAFLGERLDPAQLIGAGIILTGVSLLATSPMVTGAPEPGTS